MRQPDQRVRRQPRRRVVMAGQRQLSWMAIAQPLTYTTNGVAAGRHDRHVPGAEQAGRRRRRRRHRRADPHPADRRPISSWPTISCRTVRGTYSFGVWNNVQTSNPQTYLTSTATGVPTFGGVVELRQQRIHLEPDACEQCGVAQERHRRDVRFRSFGVELQLSAGYPCSIRTR